MIGKALKRFFCGLVCADAIRNAVRDCRESLSKCTSALKIIDREIDGWLKLIKSGYLGARTNTGVSKKLRFHGLFKLSNELLADSVVEKFKFLKNLYVPPFTPWLIPVGEQTLINAVKSIPNIDKNFWLRLDGRYYTVDIDDFKKIIKWDWTDNKKYLYDLFDCDKFAMYFKARMAIMFHINLIALVLDYSSQHAYNIVFPFEDGRITAYIYEPQTDELIRFDERDKNFYALETYVLVM